MSSDMIKSALHSAIEGILEEFQDVFQEPQGLAPSQKHHHTTVLKEGVEIPNVRLYRYPTTRIRCIAPILPSPIQVFNHRLSILGHFINQMSFLHVHITIDQLNVINNQSTQTFR